MKKEAFVDLFEIALNSALENAQKASGRRISNEFRILLYGADHSGSVFTVDEALDLLYLGEEKFYKIIDVAVVKVNKDFTTVFVRVSGHEPGDFDSTFDPNSSGPFKQLISEEIQIAE